MHANKIYEVFICSNKIKYLGLDSTAVLKLIVWINYELILLCPMVYKEVLIIRFTLRRFVIH